MTRWNGPATNQMIFQERMQTLLASAILSGWERTVAAPKAPAPGTGGYRSCSLNGVRNNLVGDIATERAEKLSATRLWGNFLAKAWKVKTAAVAETGLSSDVGDAIEVAYKEEQGCDGSWFVTLRFSYKKRIG